MASGMRTASWRALSGAAGDPRLSGGPAANQNAAARAGASGLGGQGEGAQAARQPQRRAGGLAQVLEAGRALRAHRPLRASAVADEILDAVLAGTRDNCGKGHRLSPAFGSRLFRYGSLAQKRFKSRAGARAWPVSSAGRPSWRARP